MKVTFSILLLFQAAAPVTFAQSSATDNTAPSIEDLEKELEQKQAAKQAAEKAKAAAEVARLAAAAEARLAAARAAAAARQLSCTNTGNSNNAIKLYGDLSWNVTTMAANSPALWTLKWGVNNTNSSGYSGSLKVAIWAYNDSYDRQGALGQEIVEFPLNVNGDGAQSSTQLKAGYWARDISSATMGKNPPIGKYCVAIFLYEFNTDPAICNASEHYCWIGWTQFKDPLLIQ